MIGIVGPTRTVRASTIRAHDRRLDRLQRRAGPPARSPRPPTPPARTPRSRAGIPPTSTPISGSRVNTPTSEPEADGGREAERPAQPIRRSTPLTTDWPSATSRYCRPRSAAARPTVRMSLAARSRELVDEALEVAPPVGQQEQHEDARHDVGRRGLGDLRHGVLADPGVEVVDEVLDPLADVELGQPVVSLLPAPRRPAGALAVSSSSESRRSLASPRSRVATTVSTPSSTTMTAIQRGRTRSTTSTRGSISSATTLQATTQPIVRWAATNTSREHERTDDR